MEICWLEGRKTIKEHTALQDQAKAGGVQVYNDDSKTYRAKTLKITNKLRTKDGAKKQENLHIDGEKFVFSDFIKYEVEANRVQIVGNYQKILDKFYYFK